MHYNRNMMVSHNKKNSSDHSVKSHSLIRIFAKLAWDTIGLWIVSSLSMFAEFAILLILLQVLPGASLLRIAIILVGAMFSIPPLYAGICNAVIKIASGEGGTIADVFAGFQKYYGPAVRLGVVNGIIGVVLAANIHFYSLWHDKFAHIALVICVYVVVIYGFTFAYQMPSLVMQEQGIFDDPDRKARRGAFAAIRRSAYLALGNPLQTLYLVIFSFVLVVIGKLIVVIGVLFLPAYLGLASVLFTRNLLIKYGILPPYPDIETGDPGLHIN